MIKVDSFAFFSSINWKSSVNGTKKKLLFTYIKYFCFRNVISNKIRAKDILIKILISKLKKSLSEIRLFLD